MPKVPKVHEQEATKKAAKELERRLKASAAKHSASGRLTQSIQVKPTIKNGNAGMKVSYAWYGTVLDAGLSGYDKSRTFQGGPSPFRAGHGRLPRGTAAASLKRGSGIIPVRFSSVSNWIRAKGIGDGKGSQAFLIHRGIKRKGFRATRWLQRTKKAQYSKVRTEIARGHQRDAMLFITKKI